MKILHINSYYLGTRLYQNLFDALEKLNIKEDVYVFTNKGSVLDISKYPPNIHINKCYNGIDRYVFHVKHLKVLRDIQRKIDIKKYSMIHAHSLFSNGYIAYRLKEKFNVPYIVAVRNTDVNLFFNRLIYLRPMGVKILLNAQKIIFISEAYRKHTIEKYVPKDYRRQIENKSIVIPNGVDKFWLDNKNNKRKIPSKDFIKIIYVGRVDANKNIETTVKACQLLIDQGYKMAYKIVGEITEQGYKAFIDEYIFIEYIPYCKKEELLNHYRESDIFVMPSKHETFGLVYVEAMSQGLPVIYTRGQGFDGQFTKGEIGYAVQYNSAEEIADRIEDILINYENISMNCIEKVDRFNWGRIAKSYNKIYDYTSETVLKTHKWG